MSLSDTLTIAFDATRDEAAFNATDVLVGSCPVHKTALLLQTMPDLALVAHAPGAEAAAKGVLNDAKKTSAIEKARLEAWLKEANRSYVLQTAQSDAREIAIAAAEHARFADLTLMTNPIEKWADAARRHVFESVLFESGRPILVVPADWRERQIGKRVAVAWKAGREAARAMASLQALLPAADELTLIAIEENGDSGVTSGADFLDHLKHCGVNADLRTLREDGRDRAIIFLEEAASLRADLIVMGGYSKSRLHETAFGGFTRTMLSASAIPLFISR